MIHNSQAMISVSMATQDFAAVTQLAEEIGQAVIFKDDRPKYVLIDVDRSPQIEMTDDEKIDFVARRILEQHRAAFEELAK